ncbi:hypothetical protein [Paludisphaera rhizosphaerae]|uniref:hypothetical protein n=1 Tax=Paludisphaera rhizosphaerae TaxID=2711216 RepID=UPI0013EE3ACC|nr:hypothetical protein [Paludisphaera rhizosphaerae]
MSEGETTPSAVRVPSPLGDGMRISLLIIAAVASLEVITAVVLLVLVVLFAVALAPLESPGDRLARLTDMLLTAFRRQPSFLLIPPVLMGVVFWLMHPLIVLLERYEQDAQRKRRAPPRPPNWKRFLLAVLGLLPFLFLAIFIPAWMLAARIEAVSARLDRLAPGWRLEQQVANLEAVPEAEDATRVLTDAVAKLPIGWKGVDLMKEGDWSLSLDQATAAKVRVSIDAAPEALAVARRLADYERGRGFVTMGRALWEGEDAQILQAKAVRCLLDGDAALAVEAGDLDRVVEDGLALLGAARAFGDSPSGLSQALRRLLALRAGGWIERALVRGEPSSDLLTRAQAAILHEHRYAQALTTIKANLGRNFEMFRRVGSDEYSFDADVGMYESGRGMDHARFLLPPLTLWFGWHRALLLEWSSDLLAILERPESDWSEAAKAWEVRASQVRGQWIRPLLAETFPSLQRKIVDGELRRRAGLGVVAVLLAAERHRRAAGTWPKSVAEIGAEFLPDQPLDPYNGEAFHVEHVDGRFRVYSVGPNRRDEHGSYDKVKWDRESTDDDVGASAHDPALRGRSAEGGP